MADYADLLAAESNKKSEIRPTLKIEEKEQKSIIQPTDQLTPRPTDKPVKKEKKKLIHNKLTQSVSQSTSRPTSQPTNFSTHSKTVDRPKAFYITERLDRKLDEAVRYLQDNHDIKKVDRSTIINAILDNEAYWTDESLDLLVDRVISQLTSRLTGK